MVQNRPLFSIITPTFNRAYCINKAIQSVMNQQFENWELIIIDDASTDNTVNVIKQYESDKRVSYIKLDKNSGVNVARNHGILKSKGEYIVLLDSDNELTNDILNICQKYIEKENFPYMKFLCQNQDGIYTTNNSEFYGYITFEEFLDEKLSGEYQTLIRSDMLKNNLFFETINGGEGITWKLIAKETKKVLFIPEVSIVYYDNEDDRLSLRSKNYERLAKVFKKDIEMLWKDYFKYAKLRLALNILKYFIYSVMSKLK